MTATVLPIGARTRADAAPVQEFKLARSEPKQGELTWPFSFGIAKGDAEKILLIVEGFDSGDAKAPSTIERKLVAAFESGITREIEVQLSDACADRVCEAVQTTCDPDADGCVDVATGMRLDASIHADAGEVGMDAGPVVPATNMRIAPMTKPPTKQEPAMMDKSAPKQEAPAEPVAEDMDAGVETVCDQNNACIASDYPCVPNATGGYTCQGQFADWPMPDTAPDSKVKPSYDLASSPGVVIDLNTQLHWQRMLPKNYPGCSGDEATPGDTCSWAEAKNYCQQLDLAGGGWRLPSKIELESLQGDPSSIPAIDFAAFPDLSGGQVFWTLSSWTDFKGWAWVVRSGMAMSLPEDQIMTRHVRCVRGGALASGTPRDHYRVNNTEETVTDTHTKLEWQMRYGDVDTLEAAREHCANQSNGWRLPGLNELLSLNDPTRSQPSI
ncbi:MAG TPA: DUF1566 domain-containing protein, partial [Polyangiales bacterium]|nr:DUF1566 domain-containing protein [Polyangiales bacterium]